MAIITEDILYEGNPRGVGVYNSDRSSYNGIGGGGLTQIPDEYITKSELKAALEGNSGSFIGADTSNSQITINHNLKRTNVFVVLLDTNQNEVDPGNYEVEYIDQNSLKLTIVYPFGNTTTFNYRIL